MYMHVCTHKRTGCSSLNLWSIHYWFQTCLVTPVKWWENSRKKNGLGLVRMPLVAPVGGSTQSIAQKQCQQHWLFWEPQRVSCALQVDTATTVSIMNPNSSNLACNAERPSSRHRRLISEPTWNSLGDVIVIGGCLEGAYNSTGAWKSKKNYQYDLIFTPTLMLWETLISLYTHMYSNCLNS